MNELPPGLAGYVSAQQGNDQRSMKEAQMAQAVMGILSQRAQMDEMQRKVGEQQRIRGILSSMPQGALDQGSLQRLAAEGADISPFVKLMEMQKPQEVSPGASLVGRDGKPIYTAPPKPEAPKESTMATLLRERDALPVGHPNRAMYDDAIKKSTTHQPATAVTVDTRQESEFNKKVGAEFGDQYAGLMKADMNAPTTIGKYQRLGSLLGEVGTGKFKGTTVELKAAMKGLGVDLNAMGIRDDVAPAQAAKALTNQLALELRNPAGGAGMPGALSDQDREFLLKMIPSLESDPAAWPKMIEYRVQLAKREQQVAKMARAYRRKNDGKFDEGFFDELQEWSKSNHLFPEQPKVAPAGDGWSIKPK
jgi:hypothetical protein